MEEGEIDKASIPRKSPSKVYSEYILTKKSDNGFDAREPSHLFLISRNSFLMGKREKEKNRLIKKELH